MKTVFEEACAKINLGLDVRGRRQDGYHLLKMIMQTVDIRDELRVELYKEQPFFSVELKTDSGDIPEGDDNLICLAMHRMADVYRLRGRCRVRLAKRIPVAAGMAGGSTDAAAACRALRRLFNVPVTDRELQELLLPLGADIPFCVAGGTKLCEGIGEVMTDLPEPPDCVLVVVKPPVSVSTPEIFREIDKLDTYLHPDIDGQCRALEEGDLRELVQRCGNVLELVTGSRYPLIRELESYFLERGALSACMTGSGPTVFAVYDPTDRRRAEEALEEMRKQGRFAGCRGFLTCFCGAESVRGGWISTEETEREPTAGAERIPGQENRKRRIPMRKRQNDLPELRLSEEQSSLPLRESAYLALRKAILTGGLEPGERLTEIRLGQMLGTSRTPVREAIRMLAEEGLVTITRGSGAKVAKITEEELQEVLEIRCALDQLCARLAAGRISGKGREELRRAQAAFINAIEHGSQLEIADADVAFHDVIIREAGNSKIQGILNGLADNIYRYRYEFIRDEVHYENLVKEHREICEAILSGDADRADHAARIHISRQWDSIRERLHDEKQEKQSAMDKRQV